MLNSPGYTLEQLADEFGLTPRTARYYIQELLPDGHMTGRGKLALYGQKTWNCFAFIRKVREGSNALTMDQIADVLGRLDEATIERVANGLEEVKIMPISPWHASSKAIPRDPAMGREEWSDDSTPMLSYSLSQHVEAPSLAWTELFADQHWRVLHRGPLDGKQERIWFAVKDLLKQLHED